MTRLKREGIEIVLSDDTQKLYDTLLSVAFTDWEIATVVGLDWYDGIKEGVFVLQKPVCAIRLKEVAYGQNGGGRLYRVYSFSTDAIKAIEALFPEEELAEGLATKGEKGPERFWFPFFAPRQKELDEALDVALANSAPLSLLVEIQDLTLRSFNNVWLLGFPHTAEIP